MKFTYLLTNLSVTLQTSHDSGPSETWVKSCLPQWSPLDFSATLKASQSFEDNWGRAEYSVCKMAWCSINSNSDAEHESEVIYYFIHIPIVIHGYWTCHELSNEKRPSGRPGSCRGCCVSQLAWKTSLFTWNYKRWWCWRRAGHFCLDCFPSDLNQ